MAVKRLVYLLIILGYGLPSKAQTRDSLLLPDSLQTALKADSLSTDSLHKPKVIAKRYVIRGTIKDKSTGEPVPFATAYLPGTGIGTPADPDGNFELDFEDLPKDTLRVEALSYKQYNRHIDSNETSLSLFIDLEPSTSTLKEVVITAHHRDPAIELMRKVIARKKFNDPERYDNYSYEAYNKVEIDLVHLNKQTFEKLPIPYLHNFSYIYKNMDSSGPEPFLPFYLTETVSDYYFQRKPRKTKEYIKASQVKGINNPNIINTMNRYLGNTFLTINPYDNYILFLDKKFVSPLNNAGPTFYKYTIIDTERTEGYDVFKVHFKPLRYGEYCFEGDIGIVDSSFALEHISADLPNTANLNFAKNASFFRDYEPLGDTIWFCTRENMTAQLEATPDIVALPGIIVRRTNSYKDIKLNDESITRTINNKKFKADVIVTDTANHFSEDFWENARHDTLNRNERAIYTMLDTLEQDPKYRKFKNLMRFLVSGMYKAGPVQFGPYWSVYTHNTVEGSRFQFSMGTTPKFSKDFYFNGYIAYGLKDHMFKYDINGLWLLHKEFPRSYLAASYSYDIDNTVNYYDKVNFNNAINVVVRKPGIPQKFMFAEDARFEFLKEYYSGFSHLFTLLHKEYDPYAPLPDVSVFQDVSGKPAFEVVQTEVNVLLRYAYKERFLNGNYYRVSLGSKYPIAELRYAVGIKGLLNGAYQYHRATFNVSDNVKMSPLGTLYFNVFCGKYFGTLPYPLLQIHPGNETYYYNPYAFNMMNQYEFISDQYAGFNIEHNIGGGIFNYIPVIRKLKMRQFWNAKAVIGSLSDANKELNLNKGYPFRTLEGNPYLEVGTGVENILQFFRVDFVWRLAPKKLPTEPQSKYFGVFGSFKVNF